MSNIFLKDDLLGIFDTTTESNLSLPQWVSIVDQADNTNATSALNGQLGGSFSATSTLNGQLGGSFSATSANNSTSVQDVNKLISMLTSESTSTNNQLSETTTASLENQLRAILQQDGGSKKYKSKKQSGGNDKNVGFDDVKKFFMGLKSQGVDVNVKLNDKTMSEFFGGADDTTTELPDQPDETEESEEQMTGGTMENAKKGGAIVTANEEDEDDQSGGAKKSGKKGSKKSSKKSQDGGVNAGFQAFLDLKKYIATQLGISNGPQAAKVAGAVQKEMKEKHPDTDAVKIAELGRKHFNANKDHFKQMLTK